MTTARQKFIVNKLLEKGGVVNKVATRYVMAGYRVRVNPGVRGIDIVVSRGSERYGVKVLYEDKTYGREYLDEFLSMCEKSGLKPVIILYGSGPRLDPSVFEELKEKVSIRRMRIK